MIELNYKSFGQGPPLIIVHGLFGTLDNWQTLAKSFAEKYSVFILDLRNHGRSPHKDGLFDYQVLAEDLKDFMEQHWIYKSHLLGHSMGGKTVMQFALTYPEMVDKMIVVDIAPKSYKGGHEAILHALSSLDLTTLADRKSAEDHLMNLLNEVGTVQFLLKNLSRKKEGGFEWKMNLNNLIQNYDNILDNISIESQNEQPALFIRGSNSDYVLDSDFQHIQELFPNSKIITIDDAGHWVHADKPKELFEIVDEFLSE